MNIPIDRLYHYLESLSGNDTLIYHFWPHGSKKLSNLIPMNHWHMNDFHEDIANGNRVSAGKGQTINMFYKPIIFHDQEPLFFDHYNSKDLVEEIVKNPPQFSWLPTMASLDIEKTKIVVQKILDKYNLAIAVIKYSFPAYDHCCMIAHSEKRSSNLKKYEDIGFIPVYWWSHAVIARDWFRYAEVDPDLTQTHAPVYDFLIYNRAWSGTREYRLKFVELLIQNNLQKHCLTKFSPWDNGMYYQTHQFKNSKFQVFTDLGNTFDVNTSTPCASADYVNHDYNTTSIEVVLETLFDDDRLHLTEKIFRPIACGHPFILAATQGSLEYIRSYGFKTFNPLIDEHYDTINDPLERLHTIAKEMRRIANLPTDKKQIIVSQLKSIAEYNKKHFFSQEFFDLIVNEYISNLEQAKKDIEEPATGKVYKDFTTTTYHNFTEFFQYLNQQPNASQLRRNAHDYWTAIHHKNRNKY